jgi:hypothetical protein
MSDRAQQVVRILGAVVDLDVVAARAQQQLGNAAAPAR